MSSFVPGLAARGDGIADALKRAFAPPDAFAARAIAPREPAATPRHFAPEAPGHKPTEGWDMFEADKAVAEPAPFVDPVAAARAAGYAEGLAAGRAEADTANAAQAALLAQVSDALSRGAHFDRTRMAGHLRQTVLHLVTRMIGESGIAPDVLAGRIEAATDMLADSAESAILRLHPDDVALVQDHLPKNVFPVGDAQLKRGAFIIESASTIVEDGPELWLEQLAQAIDRVPIPPAI